MELFRDRIHNNKLIVFEDLFQPKVFNVIKKPKYKLLGEWIIDVGGEERKFPRQYRIEDIVAELENLGYVNTQKFYVFGEYGYYFASSANKGSYVATPYSDWEKFSDDFFISRYSLLSAVETYLYKKGEIPAYVISSIIKALKMKSATLPFIVYKQPLGGFLNER